MKTSRLHECMFGNYKKNIIKKRTGNSKRKKDKSENAQDKPLLYHLEMAQSTYRIQIP